MILLRQEMVGGCWSKCGSWSHLSSGCAVAEEELLQAQYPHCVQGVPYQRGARNISWGSYMPDGSNSNHFPQGEIRCLKLFTRLKSYIILAYKIILILDNNIRLKNT